MFRLDFNDIFYNTCKNEIPYCQQIVININDKLE